MVEKDKIYRLNNLNKYKRFNKVKIFESTNVGAGITKFLNNGKIISINMNNINIIDNADCAVYDISDFYVPKTLEISSSTKNIALSGFCDDMNTFLTKIFTYNSDKDIHECIKENNFNQQLIGSKFMNDETRLISLNSDLKATLFDIENNNVIQTFSNPSENRIYSNLEFDFDQYENIILSNGTLYCRRSGKIIYTFPQLNNYFGGIFLPKFLEISLNKEIYDYRTFKLLCQNQKLNKMKLSRTKEDNILTAIKIDKESNILFDTLNIDFHGPNSLCGKNAVIFDTDDFSIIKKYENEYRTLSFELSSSLNEILIVNERNNKRFKKQIITIYGYGEYEEKYIRINRKKNLFYINT